MEKFDINVTYIHHSCFTIETKDYLFIIDYYKGDLPKPILGKKTIFIATHSHKDHFSKKIFDYGNFKENIYILSKDIVELYKDENIIYLNNPNSDNNVDIDTMKKLWGQDNVFILDKDEKFTYHDIDFYAYGSTDRGISILIELPYLTFYHAGDLNEWTWPEDSVDEKEKMRKDFRKEVDKINSEQVDVAFFPVDPRLKENYDKGVSYFLETVSPEMLFPMHLWGKFEFSKKLKEEYSDIYTEIKEIHHDNEEFNITMEVD
ncbi:MBL fold metallo-hydrolase [Miniphocaeibacter massiliensis]|uniref:MBL fold metallo-hydrolase n=1 Tax=Miniphocaeibacter massiliensis TaxID=2041841 RepID=UPI000C1C5210|nr:MBL fold metallo-hydrolase [Miniphocaeibacter massiliensis]